MNIFHFFNDVSSDISCIGLSVVILYRRLFLICLVVFELLRLERYLNETGSSNMYLY